MPSVSAASQPVNCKPLLCLRPSSCALASPSYSLSSPAAWHDGRERRGRRLHSNTVGMGLTPVINFSLPDNAESTQSTVHGRRCECPQAYRYFGKGILDTDTPDCATPQPTVRIGKTKTSIFGYGLDVTEEQGFNFLTTKFWNTVRVASTSIVLTLNS